MKEIKEKKAIRHIENKEHNDRIRPSVSVITLQINVTDKQESNQDGDIGKC